MGLTKMQQMRRSNQILIAALIVVVAGVGVYGIGSAIGWWAMTPPASEWDTIFIVEDYATGDVMETANIYVYETRLDFEELESAGKEYDDLDYVDYKLAESGSEDIDIVLEIDHYYFCKVNSTGYIDVWMVPIVGVNYVYMMNISESVDAVAFNSTLGSTLGSDTWNNTDTEWSMIVQCDVNYGDEDFAVSEIKGDWEGYMTVYNFPGDYYNRTIIAITFNSAPALSDCKVLEYENHKVVSGNTLYLGIDAVLVGRTTIDLKFTTGAFTGNFITDVDLMYGDISGIPTQLADAA